MLIAVRNLVSLLEEDHTIYGHMYNWDFLSPIQTYDPTTYAKHRSLFSYEGFVACDPQFRRKTIRCPEYATIMEVCSIR